MKTKKLGLITLIVLSMVFLFALNASAGWYTCTVNLAGPGFTNTYINLTDTSASPAFTNRWFTAESTQSKEMLATALTAISNSMSVWTYINSSAEYATIISLYLKP